MVGGGQEGYTKEHYLSTSLPLDYDVFIQFRDEARNEHKSSTYHIPAGRPHLISIKTVVFILNREKNHP